LQQKKGMNMFADLMGGLVDKEKITHDTIQNTLENVAEELGCSFNDFFIMIKPVNEDFDMKFYIYKMINGVPNPIREISLKEVLGGE
jgi:hypothetical protein